MTYKNAKGVLTLPDGITSEEAIRALRDGRAPQNDTEMIAALEATIENYRIACEGFEHGAQVAAARIAQLEAQIAAMRPVVDAAFAWLYGTHDGGQQDALIRAIESYQGEAHP